VCGGSRHWIQAKARTAKRSPAMPMIAASPHPIFCRPIQICCGPAVQMIQNNSRMPRPAVAIAATEARRKGGTGNDTESLIGESAESLIHDRSAAREAEDSAGGAIRHREVIQRFRRRAD
jgi:hypothetical protein